MSVEGCLAAAGAGVVCAFAVLCCAVLRGFAEGVCGESLYGCSCGCWS